MMLTLLKTTSACFKCKGRISLYFLFRYETADFISLIVVIFDRQQTADRVKMMLILLKTTSACFKCKGRISFYFLFRYDETADFISVIENIYE